jgi:UDP-N-acetylmuramyl pentapeptide synthase
VLGDMAELGADAGLLHESVGQAIRDAGIARLFAVGSSRSKRLLRLAKRLSGSPPWMH